MEQPLGTFGARCVLQFLVAGQGLLAPASSSSAIALGLEPSASRPTVS